jgi:hypothetical protein
MNFLAGAQPNSCLFSLQSSPLVLTTAMQNMPGLTFTLARAGYYLVICVVDIIPQPADAGTTISAELLVGAEPQPNTVILSPPQGLTRVTVSQQWLVKATPGTVLTMQAKKSSGTGGSTTSVQSSLTALWVSP